MSIEKGLSTGCTSAECYVHKRRVNILPLNRGLSRMTPKLCRWARIVEFMYQESIDIALRWSARSPADNR